MFRNRKKCCTPKFALGAAVRLTRAAAINATTHLRLGRQPLEPQEADAEVLKSLGMANALREAVCDENGKPPDYLTYLLKDGPGKHLKEYTYTYRKRLNIEIARINRVQVLQERVVGFWGE